MTLPTSSRVSDVYTTNGTQKDFSFGFRVFYDPENGGYGLEVRRQTETGYEVIPKSQYDVIPSSDGSSGIIRFYTPPASGMDIYIAGNTATIQQLDLTNYGRYSAESIETQFDYITAIIQEWLSSLGEETRQRIAADEILNQYVVQRINEFVQQVNQNWDDKSQEIEDYISTIMPSFTQTLREEIEAFAVSGMQDAIDQTLAESKAEIDDAVARANAAATAASITGKVYDTPEAGVDPVTGVQNGAYYSVRSPDDESYLDEYQNVGGVPTPSGKSYPSSAAVQAIDNEVKDLSRNTAYFYPTVAQMVAATKLTDGAVVATKGYHNIFDDGGAIYLISAVATNYSIPLANGLHAIFRDSFDIRKFGIRDSATLDQTAELQRMVGYADSRFYEIDFHNFNIMTPDITHFTTARGSIVKGLGFNFVHEIKNLNIGHDKTKILQQGTCNLLFLPKSNTGGTFKLSNVTFDPYVSNFNIISGEYDGMMCGFLAKAHPDWLDFDLSVVSDFRFDFKGAEFKSPAVSYNMSTAGIFSRSINLDSLSGDYWGLYVNTFTKRLTANNVRGVFRNDLHTGSGRLLVTSLIHEEPELGNATVSQDNYVIRNCSSVNTSGEKHILFKHDSVGRTHFKSISVDNCIGSFEIYDFDDERTEHLTTVDTVTVSNRALLDISLICIIGQLNIADVIESYSDIILDNIIGKIKIKGGLILNNAMGNFNGSVDSVHADLLVVNNDTYGLVRSSNISIKSIEIDKLILDSNKLVECKFDSLITHDFEQKFTGVMNNTIFNVAPVSVAKPFLQIGGFKTLASNLADFVLFNASSGGDAVIFDSNLPTPMIFTYASTISLKSTRVRASKIINPDSIPVAGSYSTTFIVQGAKNGAIIDAAFSQFNENIAVRGYISSENTVTVIFKNTGSSPVDLVEGILTIEVSQ